MIGPKRSSACKWARLSHPNPSPDTPAMCILKHRYWKRCILETREKDCEDFKEPPENYW